jgi:hypothetical protein
MIWQNICKLYLCRRASGFDCRRIIHFISNTVEYVDAGGDSCSGNGGIIHLIEGIVKYIDVVGVSCPSTGGGD